MHTWLSMEVRTHTMKFKQESAIPGSRATPSHSLTILIRCFKRLQFILMILINIVPFWPVRKGVESTGNTACWVDQCDFLICMFGDEYAASLLTITLIGCRE